MASGVDLAEAYVLRKLHKEKMKGTEREVTKMGTIGAKVNRSSGCFSWFPRRLRRPTQIRDNNEKQLIKGHYLYQGWTKPLICLNGAMLPSWSQPELDLLFSNYPPLPVFSIPSFTNLQGGQGSLENLICWTKISMLCSNLYRLREWGNEL
ncbi:hypothetical protein VNO77_31452 [Canavalia gladiata]|uniref:Uncharacterized protein n=1 Tax=Canavalia gladiata TaxID=3824 RepID=A0AAN9Q3P1_CANGL